MPTFQKTPGETIYYIEENPSGSPTMVLLHGLGVNSSSWLFQIPSFTNAGYRVIAPDLPGFGRSCESKFNGFPEMAADINSLVRSQSVDSVILIGISMGGILALQVVISYPNLVDQLILVNSMAKFSLGNPLLWPYLLWRYFLIETRGLKDQAEVVAQRLFPKPENSLFRQAVIESIMEADQESYRSAMKSIAKFNLQGHLHKINCPTLVITGEEDTTIPARNQLRMAERIPNAQHVMIRGAGHAVTIDQIEVFNSTVLQFLSDKSYKRILS